MEAIKKISYGGWKSFVVDATFPRSLGNDGLLKTLERVSIYDGAAVMLERHGFASSIARCHIFGK